MSGGFLRRTSRSGVWMAVVLSLLAVCAMGGLVGSASAVIARPGWEATSRAYPTHLPPGGKGRIVLDVYNTGAAPSSGSVIVTDTLPPGVTATIASGSGKYGVEFEEFENYGEYEYGGPLWECGAGRVVTCTSNPAFMPQLPFLRGNEFRQLSKIVMEVEVAPKAEGTFPNLVTVAGGGAASVASVSDPVTIDSSPATFGFAGWDSWFSNADGTPDTQAGSHPYEATFSLDLNTVEKGNPAGGEVRNLEVQLPSGFVGEPKAVPQCTRQQLDAQDCPAQSQIGVIEPNIQGRKMPDFVGSFPLYNMVPPPGVPDEFAFSIFGKHAFFDAGVRNGDGDHVVVHIDNLPQIGLAYASVVLWGVPAEASHDGERNAEGCRDGCASGIIPKPFLTLPASCAGPQQIGIRALSTWEDENTTAETSVVPHDNSGMPLGFTGCERLTFGPSLAIAPDTSTADTPAGLTSEVSVPQEQLTNPEGLSASTLKNVTVTLPEGVVINPGRATGLQTCQVESAALEAEGPVSCPAASQVGTAQVSTPLLPDRLEGGVYLLQSEPPDIKLLVAPFGDGVYIKLVGDVKLDPVTGRLTTTFDEAPALPFTDFKLSFSGGSQAALSTPTGCGVFTSTSDFTPWASPFLEDVFPSSSFQITTGANGSACASPLPFSPSMTAGATTDQAGGYTSFTMLLQRADGQQRISRLQFKTPPGLLGMISHVTLCGEPQASQGECPVSSQIGHTVVGAGPGPDPLYVPEAGEPEAPIYVTGSYHGAPYGLSIAVPVIAGPFNLGTTVVRGRIEVDPQTSQLTITTDPLPTILDGVPVDTRTIDAVIDRKEFVFNPTNCNPQSFSGTATSTEGATAALSSPFQVGSCRSLGFKPTFKVSTSAKTSRTQGASLHVSLTLPDEGGLSSIANVQRVKVSLPKQLPSPLKTLQKACLEKVFAENPAGCPVASQVGTVKVSTPVLPGGLTGTAYFVSHGGAKYPELILVLTGQNGVTVQVHGETFISKAGITTATFATVPDVPFSNFELTLPQREFPALTANGNLCKGTLIMPTEMVGQNGLVIQQNTKITVTGCPKTAHKKAKKKKATKHKAHGKNRKKR